MTDMEYMQEFTFVDSELDWVQPLVDDILDPNLRPVTNFPVTSLGPPDRTDFSGACQFTVEISSDDTNKKKYLYSHILNCIFVDRKCNFSIQFNWKPFNVSPLYVRATTVFSDKAQAQKRVETCLQHKYDNSLESNGVANLNEHVLHSGRSADTSGVFYCGDPSQADSWYSVLVQFPVGGPKSHAYSFFCKNSCSSGINRRSIGIIFTLEDASGNVYGRQYVGARVCSCPRRDITRDEKAAGATGSGKRRIQRNTNSGSSNNNGLPPTLNNDGPTPDPKRIKLEGTSDEEITLPPLKVVGVQATITGLKVMVDMMRQRESLTTDSQTLQRYKESVESIENILRTLENK